MPSGSASKSGPRQAPTDAPIPPVGGRWKVVIVDEPGRAPMQAFGLFVCGEAVPGYMEIDVDLYCYIGGVAPELLEAFDLFERVEHEVRGVRFLTDVPLETWPG